MVEVAANLLVAFLLVLTTTWCVLLYRRLDRLRVERRDIESFVAAIDAATQRAETAIAGLRAAAGEAHQALSGQQEQAQQRLAELARLVDSSGRMARRLEAAVHQGARVMVETAAPAARGRGALGEPVAGSSPDERGGASPAAPVPRRPDERPSPPRLDADLLCALEALR